MKSLLVTGGAGYIGSHTCKRLAAAGYEPVSYDNLSSGHREFVKWGPLIEGDINDKDKLVRTLKKHRPQAVIHFAASAYIGESMVRPLDNYANNVGWTLSLLDAMRQVDLRNLVFSSSCATYGSPACELIDENCLQNPISPYGRSKLMVESMLRDLASVEAIRHVSLRYFNAAGADRAGEIGEWHEPETHLVPLAIQAGLGGAPLKIFGTDYATPDGTAIRDFIHVEDLAEAHLLAVEHLMTGKPSEFLNLGSGQAYSVQNIIDGLAQLGHRVELVKHQRRPGNPARLVAECSKAKEVLNWTARHSGIDEILKSALAWHRTRLKD